MKIELDYALSREVIEVDSDSDSLTITGWMIASGDRVIAEITAREGQVVWQDTDGNLVGAITVTP